MSDSGEGLSLRDLVLEMREDIKHILTRLDGYVSRREFYWVLGTIVTLIIALNLAVP